MLHSFFIQKDKVDGEVSVVQKTPFHSDIKSGNYILIASLKKLVISIIKLYMQTDQSRNSTNVNKFQGITSGYHIHLKRLYMYFFPPNPSPENGKGGHFILAHKVKHLVTETNFTHNILSIFRQFHLQPLHVSDLSRSIIRRNDCIYATLGILLLCIASCLVCTPDS